MRRFVLGLAILGLSTPLLAAVTLKCVSKQRCDGYIENCVNDPMSITVTIEPDKNRVTIGGKQIDADFSNPALATFKWLDYTVDIDKYEYSMTLYNDNEVRAAWCEKVEPAW